MRDDDFNPSDLQKALLGYEPSELEKSLLAWAREHWTMAARGMPYATKEAADTVSGIPGVRSDEAKRVLEVAARVAIGERDLMCRTVAAILPAWLEETYGLTPK